MSPAASLHSPEFDRLASELAEVGRFLAERGWSPATSSNYSAKWAAPQGDLIAISRSGVDKFSMAPNDFMVIAAGASGSTDFRVVAPAGDNELATARPSAETRIHTAIYQARPSARAILHTHSPHATRLSLKFLTQGELALTGYEMQKGIDGFDSHETRLLVPIVPNDQDMVRFGSEVSTLLSRLPHAPGFLIAGHGLYTWGPTIAATKRHVEALEFLFACLALELAGV